MGRSGISIRKDLRKLEQIIRETPQKADDALRGAAIGITADIVLSFGTSPSEAGDPPGVDTGALRASMRWEKVGRLHYQVMDGVLYGAFLEFGTEKMAARPFVNPVIEEWRAREFSRFIRAFGLIT